MTLGEDGLRKSGKLVAGSSEEDIYSSLGLSFIPPELREGRGEIERALEGKLPPLVTDDDIRGILHAHTLRIGELRWRAKEAFRALRSLTASIFRPSLNTSRRGCGTDDGDRSVRGPKSSGERWRRAPL